MLARRLKWWLFARLIGSMLIGAGMAGVGGKGWIIASLLVFLLADAPLLGLAYVVSRRSGAPVVRGAKADFFGAAAAALREWAAFTAFYAVVQPFERFWMGDERCARAPGGACPCCWRTAMSAIAAYGCGCGPPSRGGACRSRPSISSRSLATSTCSPSNCAPGSTPLLAETGAQKVVIATHSMGGLVARAYLRRHGEDKVAALVTVGVAASRHQPGLPRRRPGRAPDGAGQWLAERPQRRRKLEIPVTSIEGVGRRDCRAAEQRALARCAINISSPPMTISG